MDILITLQGRQSDSARDVCKVTLPVILGRGGADGTLTVRQARGGEKVLHDFGIDDSKISRSHVLIEEGPDGPVVTDRSTNGTRRLTHAGQEALKPQMPVALDANAQLELGKVVVGIRPVTEGAPGVSAHTVEVTTPSARKLKLDFATGAIVLGQSNGRAYVVNLEHLDRIDTDLPDWAMYLKEAGSRVELTMRATAEAGPEFNRVALRPGESQVAEHHSVIDFHGHRVVVWKNGGPGALECPNPACRLLNTRSHGDNCRFCGAKLDTGDTYIVS